MVILEAHKKKLNDLVSLAKFKNVYVLLFEKDNELRKYISYNNKIIKIKDIEIEVND